MLSNIEAERARNSLSKEEISKILGITPKTYYNYINEKQDIPSSILIKLSKLFGTTIDYLLS